MYVALQLLDIFAYVTSIASCTVGIVFPFVIRNTTSSRLLEKGSIVTLTLSYSQIDFHLFDINIRSYFPSQTQMIYGNFRSNGGGDSVIGPIHCRSCLACLRCSLCVGTST